MDQRLGQEYEGEARVQFLRDNCDAVEEIGFNRKFTPEEIIEKKDHLAIVAIEINDVEIEKKEVMKDFKERIDPLQSRKVALLKDIKLKSEWSKESCFKFIDHDTRTVTWYDCEGILVDFRAIRPEEAQLTIHHMNVSKTGTND
jgi:hypothetical protein